MEILLTEKGKNKGRISVTRTLNTLAVGESWTTNTSEVDLGYLRVACHNIGRRMNREFSVSNTLDMGNIIVITRIA
jgi:hypothetical protein